MIKIQNDDLFSALKEYFKIYLPRQKHVSPNTIRAYQNAMESLLDYIVETKNMRLTDISFDTINHQLLYEYLEWLEYDCGCTASTRNHRLQCIRAFYAFVAETYPAAVAYRNDILKVKPVKTPKAMTVDYMSETAIKALLSAPETNNYKGVRDALIMIVLYDTGARIQEVLNIRIADINFYDATITIYGKGQKIRCVTLMENTVSHLKNYLNIYHHDYDKTAYLFYTVRNGEQRPMTTDNARRMIKKYAETARLSCNEVPENVHPHLFRHSRAMHLYQHGMPLALVSQWLGHSRVETTLIYAYADTEMKRKAIEIATSDDNPLREFLDSERYTIDDENLIKKLYGLR